MKSLSRAFFAVVFLMSVTVFSGPYLPEKPDPQMTPGDVCDVQDEDFAEFRYKEKIPYCARNVSHELKTQIYRLYKVADSNRRNYTIDHFIPLSIGGSNQPANLWPEHKKIKETRMNLELEIYEKVRAGKMTQAEAIERIVSAKMSPEFFVFDL